MRFTISLDSLTWLWLLQEMDVHPNFVNSLFLLLGDYSTFVTYAEDGNKPEHFRKRADLDLR